MIRKHYGEWLLGAFAAGIVLGTAAVNLAGNGFRERAGEFEAFLAGSLAAGGGQGWELLKAVAVQRLGETALLWALGRTAAARICCCGLAAYLGISVSAVLAVFTLENGMMGLPLYLASVLPQGLCYIPVWLFLAGSAGSHGRMPVRYVLAGAAILGAGICCECFVSPWIFRRLWGW